MTTDLDDYRWLVSGRARPFLDRAVETPDDPLALAKWLRRELTAGQARLVAQQVELRKRAHVKFRNAAQMFFTKTSLEQATDETIAAYKASRYPAERSVTDFCCGIGGDLLALANVGHAVGVDQDPRVCLLAQANCRAFDHSVQVVESNAEEHQLPAGGSWHADPDRRAQGRRATRFSDYEPAPDWVERVVAGSPAGAIKLAPATVVPPGWLDMEREWIGSRGECRQQVLWFGPLAQHDGRTATIVAPHGEFHQVQGKPDLPIEVQAQPGQFIFEPHAVILAAKLEGALSAQLGLRQFGSSTGYLTSDVPVTHPMLSAFQTREVLPFDRKRVAKLLRNRSVARLEIKHRGLEIDPVQLERALKLEYGGQEELTLLIAGRRGSSLAIIATRV